MKVPTVIIYLIVLLHVSLVKSVRPRDLPLTPRTVAGRRNERDTKHTYSTTVASLLMTGGGEPKRGMFSWFKPGSPRRTKALATWLLIWDCIALVDAIMFTFRPSQNLNGYLVGDWGSHTMAMTRMLANCQLGLIASIALIACTGDEKTIKNIFKLLILITMGAFRAVYAGVSEGTIKAPWKTGYAAVMSAPPLLLLSYFAFVF